MNVLDTVIRFQQALPIMLPNEYFAWKQYSKHFSKTCDSCHDEKGIYKITYQDPKIPITTIYPVPVRFCADCLCEADENVGIMEDVDEEGSFEIERV